VTDLVEDRAAKLAAEFDLAGTFPDYERSRITAPGWAPEEDSNDE
jgi:hypothetical protein